MKSSMRKYMMTAILSMLILAQDVKAEVSKEYSYGSDYASGCALGFASGLIAAGLASTRVEKGDTVTPVGYAVSGALSCLTAMALVGVIGSQAEFNTAWKYDQDITNLTYELKRANKERCLLTGRCSPAGNAIIVESEDGTKKVGDKVITSTTFTLEANE